MDNISIITDERGIESVIIDRGNGEFTSMLKSTYDAQIAASDTLPSNSSIPQAGE